MDFDLVAVCQDVTAWAGTVNWERVGCVLAGLIAGVRYALLPLTRAVGSRAVSLVRRPEDPLVAAIRKSLEGEVLLDPANCCQLLTGTLHVTFLRNGYQGEVLDVQKIVAGGRDVWQGLSPRERRKLIPAVRRAVERVEAQIRRDTRAACLEAVANPASSYRPIITDAMRKLA